MEIPADGKDQNNLNVRKSNFDLERRTTNFAKKVIKICQAVPRNPINDRITGQLAGCSGSIGANYREANDALGKKDFLSKIKTSRREAKETIHWLELLMTANPRVKAETELLISEAVEYKNIFSAIIKKVEQK